MQLGKIIGTVVATQKQDTLQGVRLMVVQPINGDGAPVGTPIVAGDAIGAGVGEVIFYAKSKDGSFALPLQEECCCDAGISAIVDTIYRKQ